MLVAMTGFGHEAAAKNEPLEVVAEIEELDQHRLARAQSDGLQASTSSTSSLQASTVVDFVAAIAVLEELAGGRRLVGGGRAECRRAYEAEPLGFCHLVRSIAARADVNSPLGLLVHAVRAGEHLELAPSVAVPVTPTLRERMAEKGER